jgi:hypothetical protein
MIREYVEKRFSIHQHARALKKDADGNTLPDSCSPSDKPPQPAKISRVARHFSDINVSFPEPACSSSQICFPLFFFEAGAFLVRVMSLTLAGSWFRDKTTVNYLKKFLNKIKAKVTGANQELNFSNK